MPLYRNTVHGCSHLEDIMRQKIVTGKPELLKRINRNLIIKLIIKEGEVSRSQLARLTGLALPSVMRIVEGLVAEGLVEDLGKGDSTGGRKPTLIRLNADYMYIVGIEIAIESTIVITNFKGEPIESWTSPQLGFIDPDELLNTLLKQLEFMLDEKKIDRKSIAGVGIGTPGTNFKHMHSVKRAIMKGWEDIDVLSWFSERTTYPIVVENVARTRTLSELWFGYGKELKNFLYVFVDQGVGVGIVQNGMIYKGASGVAGEFGHMSVDYQGRECYCGNKGCIEMYVSAGAIINAVDQLRTEPPENAPLKPLKDPVKNPTFTEVALRSDEPAVAEIMKDAGDLLAFGIANVVNFYNPEAVILGGIVPKMCPAVAKQVIEHMDAYIFNRSAMKIPVLVSKLENEKHCLGSIALVIDNCFKTVEL